MSARPNMSNLAMLIPKRTRRSETFRYATVTQTSPLRIKLDGETTALGYTPDTLVSGLVTNDRVLVGFIENPNPNRGSRKLAVLGKAGGARVGCTLLLSANQAATSGNNTVISWSSATYNSPSMWTTGTNVTIPVDGIYAMTFVATLSGAIGGSRAYLALEITSGPLWRLPFNGSSETTAAISITAPLSAGNVLTAKLMQSSGGSLNINPAQLDCYRIAA